jgi:hypothetical protein
MGTILFTCPITDVRVQHWLDDEENASDETYEEITCLACDRLHFVNRRGEVFGDDTNARSP